MFQTGYIINPRQDYIWFIGLPLVALAAALGSQNWLPFVALASINLWITVPHHFATWFRTYGLAEDWRRFKERLIIGPIVIYSFVFLGLQVAPITLLLVVSLWDHQHSIMQQHGFARIYDFKAKAGTPQTPRWDLALNWILYGNMFLNAPLMVTMWLRELYRLNLVVPVGLLQGIQLASWTVTALFLVVYTVHIIRGSRQGYPINPMKYLFLAASYFLWYYAAWHTASILVFGIAHRLMHGLQYIVMVLFYVRRKRQADGENRSQNRYGKWLFGSTLTFVLISVVYAVIYQLAIQKPMNEFGFGLFNIAEQYPAIPEHGIEAMPGWLSLHLLGEALISAVAVIHYYFDSFIWKVRDEHVQEGL